MKPTDEKKFSELMLAMGEVFQKIPTDTQMEIYFRALEDMSIEQVSHALSEIVKTRKITGTLPLPAEIREIAGGNIDDKAQLAWNKLNWTLEHVGFGNSVAFDDPILMRTIQLWTGGWRKLRDLDWRYDQMPWRQKEFMAAYKTANHNHIEAPEYFPGDYELDNESKGFISYIPKPFLISGVPGKYYMIPGPGPKQLPDMNEVKRLER